MGRIDAILARPVRVQILIATLIGAFAALGQVPFGLWPATVVSLAALFGLIRRAPGWRRATMLSWAAGTGYFILALFWIVEPFMVDAARHGWMAPFALFFLSLGLAIFWALVGAVTSRFKGQAAAFIAAFVLVEAIRTYALTGFPWAQLGHVLIDTSWLHIASYTGSLGLTALVVIGGTATWHILEKSSVWGAAFILLPAGLFGLGWGMTPSGSAAPDAPVVRLIQPNAPQHQKWDPEMIPVFFDRQIEFTSAPPTAETPDLIVWPETSVPVILERADAAIAAMADAAVGVPIVAGIQRLSDDRFYNSLIRIDETGAVASVYDKHHLVPFGEYMPFNAFFAHLGISGLADLGGGGYTPGPGPQVIDMAELGTALPLICYEGVFPHNVGSYDERPSFLLMITNDAWFGEASGPYQHLAQARLRSAEQGLPMIRVANTGVSAMIDATGHVTHSLPLGEAGWVDAPLPPALPKTLYARMGDLPIIVFFVVLQIVAARRAGRVAAAVNG
jgi:apolipoprotein N-acyltransferase